MLQNRVDPFGNIIKTSARGRLMGNRGLLHNDIKELLRPYKLHAWITCKLEFKNRRRQVMTPGLYTELFFMDEATSFAAGHRPCFECRRSEAEKFKTCWLKAHPEHRFNSRTSIKHIDDIIHHQRISNQNQKVTYQENAEALPDGTFVLFDDEPYLIKSRKLLQWTPFGYEKDIPLSECEMLKVLTPRSIVNAFRAGYVPAMNTT
jgi:hypothetical protein